MATALERGIRVIPVLVGGASMPKADELPPQLRKFVDCNAIAIDDSRFRQDFDNLVDAIMGRPRGFARRELDRLQRGIRVLKVSSLLVPVIALLLLFTAWMQVFDFFLLDTRVASYSMWLGERFAGVAARVAGAARRDRRSRARSDCANTGAPPSGDWIMRS